MCLHAKHVFSNQFGWYLSFNCVITEKCVFFDNNPLLKFRLELWSMWTYFRNSNDCFIKSQTVGKSSNWGFGICWICILGCSVLKLGITLWKASIQLSLNILFELQCRKKWCSLSITLQLSHNLCSFGIFLYLPISIFKLWSLMRNFVRSCLFLKLVSFSKYSSNLPLLRPFLHSHVFQQNPLFKMQTGKHFF